MSAPFKSAYDHVKLVCTCMKCESKFNIHVPYDMSMREKARLAKSKFCAPCLKKMDEGMI